MPSILLTNLLKIYDQVLDHVDFKSLECSCGAKGSFVKIGCYPRFYKTATNKICIRIQRVMCKHCGKTHAVFVECMVPSSMLLLTTQIEMLRSYYNHRLEEFLSSYPTIDRPNAIYVIKNYERKWVNTDEMFLKFILVTPTEPFGLANLLYTHKFYVRNWKNLLY